ncbi:MAG: hypothetical protein JST92_23400 [Deltaproteobacteria bacterium]|nr:hypothetical protein [Deltaproteobacteria bacterium]
MKRSVNGWLAIGALCVCAVGCGSNDTNNTQHDAGQDAGFDAGTETWTDTVIDSNTDGGLEMSAAVDPSGKAGVAFFRKDNFTADGGPSELFAIVYAHETSPGVWAEETIANAAGDGGTYLTGHYGLALAYDPSGNPAITYMGGGITEAKPGMDGRWHNFATGLSMPSDSVMIRKSGSAWTKTTLGTMSNSFVTTGNSVDDQGVVLGLWSALAYTNDGIAHVVQRDIHYGNDDTASSNSDLEAADVSSGGALSNGAIVASNQTPSNPLIPGAGTYTQMVATGSDLAVSFALSPKSTSAPEAVWFARRTGTTWTRKELSTAQGQAGSGPALAYSPTRGFAIAYFDAQLGDSRLLTSADGTTWDDEPNEVLGVTGLHPGAAFSGETLGVLWSFCRSPIDPDTSCNADTQELRFRTVAIDGTPGPVETVKKTLPNLATLLPTSSGGASFIAIYQDPARGTIASRRTP